MELSGLLLTIRSFCPETSTDSEDLSNKYMQIMTNNNNYITIKPKFGKGPLLQHLADDSF
jgi:hypothetical protein